ncbi:MAG: 7TM diverse intracellular signaling domain-containing protein [Mucilaginibacter sp.]|uniref:sensor histidine kinase n=1 Tax=Mucilaginibacter sp. TaxID=1882438 RepID=UPI0031AD364C
MKYLLIMTCLIWQSAIAFAYNTDTLTINTHESNLLTNQYFKELEDSRSNVLSINQVFNSNKFHSIQHQLTVLQYSKPSTWLKFSLKNNTTDSSLIINAGSAIIDQFDLYYIDHKSTVLKHLAPEYSPGYAIAQNNTFISIPIASGTSNTFYLHVKSIASTTVAIKVYSTSAFFKKRDLENIIVGVMAGVFVIMALYNLLLFFIVGDRSYLYYVCYITFFGLAQILKRGYGGNLFTANITVINNYVIPLVRASIGLSILLFISEFLQVKQNLKQLHKYYLLLYIPYFFAFAAILLGKAAIAYTLITASLSFTATSLLVIGAYLYFKGFKPAKFFMLGWGFFLLSILVSVMLNKGYVPYNNFTADIVVYCSFFELILFSAALAEKINFYRQLKNESQSFALSVAQENERLITEQNIILENKVKERTNELINTNKNLSVSIDHLTATQKQLANNEKMASLGQLTAGVAHEINNPINFVSSNISPLRLDFNELILLLNKYDEAIKNPGRPDLLQELDEYKRKVDPDFIKEEITILLNGIEDGANRTAEIVNSLRTFSSTDEQVLKTEDINKSILNNLLILRSTIPYYIEIKPVFDKLQPLNCYPGKISQLIINLINNSIYAIKAKAAHTSESIMIITKDLPDHISIEITDTGIGMSDATKQRIFEPFFTTKGIGEGTGLGLSIVFGIIEKHEGSIEVISSVGNGASFIVQLPKNLT